MPFRLKPPKEGRSAFYRVRGTYRGVYLDRTTETASRAEALRFLNFWRDQVDRGELAKEKLTLEAAAMAYVKAGNERRFIDRLFDHFGEGFNVHDIDQGAVDEAAHSLYPHATPATRNRQVYTPIAAILKHNGVALALRRPKGAQGARRTTWLTPAQFERLAQAAETVDPEMQVLMLLLCYTGMRLGEGLALTCDKVDLAGALAMVAMTKNGDPRAVHLPPRVVAALANHPRGLDRGEARLFHFVKGGAFNRLARRAYAAAQVDCGGAPFHVLRHTWGTWMTRTGADLVATGAWRSNASARGYQHFVASEEALKADRLPGAKAESKA